VTAQAVTAHALGPVDQIPIGEGRAFDVGGEQVAVFRLRDGSLRALSAVCPHRGGPIADGQIDDRIVLCPLHLNAFDLATGCSITGEQPLRRFDVTVTDDEIILTR
jgi:nitrite reductase/ring-hydroxylating ferredoxin subunit